MLYLWVVHLPMSGNKYLYEGGWDLMIARLSTNQALWHWPNVVLLWPCVCVCAWCIHLTAENFCQAWASYLCIKETFHRIYFCQCRNGHRNLFITIGKVIRSRWRIDKEFWLYSVTVMHIKSVWHLFWRCLFWLGKLLTLYLSIVSIPSSKLLLEISIPELFLYWQCVEGSVSVIVESFDSLHNFPTTTLQFVFNKLSFCKATHKTFPCDVPNHLYNNNNCFIRSYLPMLYV